MSRPLAYENNYRTRQAFGKYIDPKYQPTYIVENTRGYNYDIDNKETTDERVFADDADFQLHAGHGSLKKHNSRYDSPVDSVYSDSNATSDGDIFSDDSEMENDLPRFSSNNQKKSKIDEKLEKMIELQKLQLETLNAHTNSMMMMQQQQQHLSSMNSQQQQQQEKKEQERKEQEKREQERKEQEKREQEKRENDLRYPAYMQQPQPRRNLNTIHSTAMPSAKRDLQALQESSKHSPNGEPRVALGMWLPSSGQEVFSHRNVTQNRMLGGYEAPERVLVAPPLENSPEAGISAYDASLFEERFDTRERLVSTGFMVNAQTGEAVEVFENEMPPPTVDRSIEPSQMQRANPLLTWMNGGYDENQPRRKKTEVELEVPGADAGPNVFGDALYEKKRKEEVSNRINRELFHNQKGNMSTVATMGEHPVNMMGYQDVTPRIAYMPATQRSTINTSHYWQNVDNAGTELNPSVGDREWAVPAPNFTRNDLTENTKRHFGAVGGDETAVQPHGGYIHETPEMHARVKREGDGQIVKKSEFNLYKAAVAGFMGETARSPDYDPPNRLVNTSRGNDDNPRLFGAVETAMEASLNEYGEQTVRNLQRGSADTDATRFAAVQTQVQGPHVFDARTTGRAKKNVDTRESSPMVVFAPGEDLQTSGAFVKAQHKETTKKALGQAPVLMAQENEALQNSGWVHQTIKETTKKALGQAPLLMAQENEALQNSGWVQQNIRETNKTSLGQAPVLAAQDNEALQNSGWVQQNIKETTKKSLGQAPVFAVQENEALQNSGWVHQNIRETTKKSLGQAPVLMAQDNEALQNSGWVQQNIKETTKRALGSFAPGAVDVQKPEAGDARHAGQKGRAKKNVDVMEDPFPQIFGFSLDMLGMGNTLLKAERTPTTKKQLGSYAPGAVDVAPGLEGSLVKSKQTRKAPTRNQHNAGHVGIIESTFAPQEGSEMTRAGTVQKAKTNVDVAEGALYAENNLRNPSAMTEMGTVIRQESYKGRKTKKQDLVEKTYAPSFNGTDTLLGMAPERDTKSDPLRGRGKMLKHSGLREAYDYSRSTQQVYDQTGGGERMILEESGFQRGNVVGNKSRRGSGEQGAYEERRRLSASFSQGDEVTKMAPRGVPEQYVKPEQYLTERQRSPVELQSPYEQFNRYPQQPTIYSEYVV